MNRAIILSKIDWYVWRHKQKNICQKISEKKVLADFIKPYCCGISANGFTGHKGPNKGYSEEKILKMIIEITYDKNNKKMKQQQYKHDNRKLQLQNKRFKNK